MLNKLRFLMIASFLFVAGQTLFAQAKAPLTIIASEGPAQVLLNGRLFGIANTTYTVQISPGRYDLIVRKTGRPEFRQSIVVTPSGLTVNANLGGAPQVMQPERVETKPLPPPVVNPLYNLSITANVPGAQVTVNGSPLGQAPLQATLAAGTYQITVSAPGYEPYSATVPLSGNTTHAATLRQIMNRLTVTSNVNGAEVFINGVKAGNAPFSADLAPGSYNLRVAAPGYQDFNSGVAMTGPQTVTASLAPLFSTINVVLPAQFTNRDTKPREHLEFYVDGVRQNGPSAQVSPGQRTLRIVSGDFAVETVVSITPGRVYTIEPTLALNIR